MKKGAREKRCLAPIGAWHLFLFFFMIFYLTDRKRSIRIAMMDSREMLR